MVFSTRDTLALETDEQTTIRRERLRTVDAIRRSLRGTNSRVTTSDESRLEMLITANSLNSKISANTVGDVELPARTAASASVGEGTCTNWEDRPATAVHIPLAREFLHDRLPSVKRSNFPKPKLATDAGERERERDRGKRYKKKEIIK